MKYTQKQFTSGSWVDKTQLVSGMKAKIVSETKPSESNFKDKEGNIQMQDVAKVHFQGQPEAVNVSLNRATIAGLISAFGDDSANWQGHVLTTEVEKMRIGGKAVIGLYLIPEGYKKTDDENGFAVIAKEGEVIQIPAPEDTYPKGPNPDDIPW